MTPERERGRGCLAVLFALGLALTAIVAFLAFALHSMSSEDHSEFSQPVAVAVTESPGQVPGPSYRVTGEWSAGGHRWRGTFNVSVSGGRSRTPPAVGARVDSCIVPGHPERIEFGGDGCGMTISRGTAPLEVSDLGPG